MDIWGGEGEHLGKAGSMHTHGRVGAQGGVSGLVGNRPTVGKRLAVCRFACDSGVDLNLPSRQGVRRQWQRQRISPPSGSGKSSSTCSLAELHAPVSTQVSPEPAGRLAMRVQQCPQRHVSSSQTRARMEITSFSLGRMGLGLGRFPHFRHARHPRLGLGPSC